MKGIRSTALVLGTAVDITTHASTCEQAFRLASERRSAYICFATAHMLVEATRDHSIKCAYRDADAVNPDGTPVAWCLRMMGHAAAECVSGPRVVPMLLKEAEAKGVSVGFYGGRPETLQRMQEVLQRTLPRLRVAYVYSPPFRPLSSTEHEQVIADIHASGAELLFVGLGSPKQERWMQQTSPLLNCTCLGVGAAFEFLSGEKVMPPLWLQQTGLTWLARLCQEPRRLARRNLYSPVFAAMFLGQLLARLSFGHAPTDGSLAGEQPE